MGEGNRPGSSLRLPKRCFQGEATISVVHCLNLFHHWVLNLQLGIGMEMGTPIPRIGSTGDILSHNCFSVRGNRVIFRR